MTNRYNILNLLLSALVLLLPSCISLEDYETDADRSKTIEFVCRPTSYDGQEVLTKATTVDDFENKVHNCYFMLYDNSGTRVYGPVDLNATLATQRFSKSEFKLNVGELATYTACFVANVSKSIVDGLNTLSKVNSTVLDIAYSSADVSDTDNSYKPSSFVVPEFVLEDGGEAVQCLPMFGMQECNVAADDIFQISLKRLFAKVTVSVGLGSLTSSFDVMAAHLFNLPTKVKLSESSNESEWVEDVSSFLQQQIEGPIGHQITSSLSSAYELYFYVPEYYLNGRDDRSGNYGNEKFKPNMYDTDKNPVLFRLFGEYGGLTGGDTGVQYDLYLGENAATSFTLKRNKHYINSMVINGITNRIDGSGNTLDCRVTVSEEGLDEVEIIGQTANCYVIGKTGSYIYPACKGVHKGGFDNIPDNLKCSQGTHLEIEWSDNNDITLENLAYNDESKEFSFDVTKVGDGNVILALKDDEGNIEWSWHLWFITGFSIGNFETDWFEMDTQTLPNGKVMMDRNLGANVGLLQTTTPGIATGLYYKYGDKNPYIDNDYRGGGAADAYVWSGDDKSQTDPCPPGYRVPSQAAWEGFTPTDKFSSLYSAHQYYDNGTTNTSDDVYYPYSGYIDDSLELQREEVRNPDPQTPMDVYLPHEQNPWGTTITYGDITRPTYPQRFLNVEYRIHDLNVVGYVSTTNSKLFKCAYVSTGVEIIKCDFQQGTWDKSGGFFGIGATYKANYTGSKLRIDKPGITGDELKANYPTQYEDLIKRIQVLRAGNIVSSFLQGFQQTSSSNLVENENTSYGYQVRCVKE